MYNVLIVEDEMLVRVGIKASIDWGKYNMHIVGDAIDGMTGLNLLQKLKPDILITDINLPRLNGVQLIEEAYKINPNCAIIVISCIDDFDLLRELLQFNIIDYLLKSSIGTKDIEATLLKAKKRLDQLRIDEDAEKTVQLECDDQITNYILNENCSIEFETDEQYNMWQIYLHITRYQGNINIIAKTVIEMLTQYFENHSKLIAITKGRDKIMIMIKNSELSKEIILKKLLEFQAYLYKALNIEVFCDIEKNTDGYKQLKLSFNQFCEYKEHIDVFNRKNFIYESFISKQHQKISNIIRNTMGLFRKYNHHQKVLGLISDIENLLSCDLFYFNEFKIISNNLMTNIADAYQCFLQENLQETEKNCIAAKTYSQIYRLYRNLLSDNVEFYGLNKNSKLEIKQSLEYIHENYNTQITLDDIAMKVSFSPNYLSSTFKREIGITLVEYLIRHRIEKAEHLLENTEDYLYEVAEKTGFSNESYFSKMFKKVTGFSPLQWRRLTKEPPK